MMKTQEARIVFKLVKRLEISMMAYLKWMIIGMDRSPLHGFRGQSGSNVIFVVYFFFELGNESVT